MTTLQFGVLVVSHAAMWLWGWRAGRARLLAYFEARLKHHGLTAEWRE